MRADRILQVVDYTIVEGSTALNLGFKVGELLAKGWQPWGSGYGFDNDGQQHHQPMVRYSVTSSDLIDSNRQYVMVPP